MRDAIVLTAVLLAGCRAVPSTERPAPRGFLAALVVAEADRMGERDLWPGFDPRAIPVAISDGQRTWLFRHPAPPEGFVPVPGRAGVFVYPGRHPAVTANTRTSLGGATTAVLLLDGARAALRSFAATLVHEMFHVHQHQHHPTWTANEVELFTYPATDTEALAPRRLETGALRRALAARSDGASACWAREALRWRSRRFARLSAGAVAYERGVEVVEGVSEYVEERARGTPAAASVLRVRYGPDAVRQRGYAAGLAFAKLMDRFEPAWREAFERHDSTTLDRLLAIALERRTDLAARCGFGDAAEASARRAAARDVAELLARRSALRRAFLAPGGWTLEIAAEQPPLYPEGFDPLNVHILSSAEVLHTRFLQLGGPAGTVEVMGRPGLTRSAGTHPLFEGVRSLVVRGLPAEPAVRSADGRVTVEADGVRASLARAVVERDARSRTLTVRSP